MNQDLKRYYHCLETGKDLKQTLSITYVNQMGYHYHGNIERELPFSKMILILLTRWDDMCCQDLSMGQLAHIKILDESTNQTEWYFPKYSKSGDKSNDC